MISKELREKLQEYIGRYYVPEVAAVQSKSTEVDMEGGNRPEIAEELTDNKAETAQDNEAMQGSQVNEVSDYCCYRPNRAVYRPGKSRKSDDSLMVHCMEALFGEPTEKVRTLSREMPEWLGKSGEKKRSLDDLPLEESFAEALFRLIDEKGFTDAEVYKRAGLDRRLFSKIRSKKDYQPKKSTALALAIALKLNLDETRDFLARAGYALSHSFLTDVIVEYCIKNEIYDLMVVNEALYENGEALLSA